MHIFQRRQFGDVTAFQFGFGPVGKPVMYEFDAVFCAHNPRLKDGKLGLDQKLQFLEDLVGRVRHYRSKGLAENEIIRKLDPRKDRWVKLMTFGNVSFANMVRSAIRGNRPPQP